MAGVDGGLAARLREVLPHLDERQRRLLMGAEARAWGHGGVRAVARAAGVREATVAAGVGELAAGAEPSGRARQPGGGRKRAVEVDPGLRPALLALVEPQERGDPTSLLRWTTRSTRALAAELTRQGHRVGADTVAALLHEEGFSLQGNAKTLEGRRHPDRDAQFRYIDTQARAHRAGGDPVVSVDAKKKEQVGPFAQAGRTWRPKGDPVRVRSHDFPDERLGTVTPYGVYDLATDTGWVNVGTDHDTAAFAVESVRRWWNGTGRRDHPAARRLLVTADAGGSNGYRTRTWKNELAALAVETGLEITVCHFPPGTSKWNKVEHRLFSHITMNWRGQPLTSHDVVVAAIAATTTRTGLHVHAQLDTDPYPLGVAVPDTRWAVLPLRRHTWHGDWNYTLRPEPYAHRLPPPRPIDRPTPHLAWLTHPRLTGLTEPDWDALVATLTELHEQHRQAGRRPGRPFRRQPHTPGLRLTLADDLAATFLYHRLALPQTAIAPLYATRADTINKHISHIRDLLHQTGHTIDRGPDRTDDLDDLYTLATTAGITIPDKVKQAS